MDTAQEFDILSQTIVQPTQVKAAILFKDGNKFQVAPVLEARICQGTMLLWCSISVMRILSPGPNEFCPRQWATRLMDSVVPRVKIMSDALLA